MRGSAQSVQRTAKTKMRSLWRASSPTPTGAPGSRSRCAATKAKSAGLKARAGAQVFHCQHIRPSNHVLYIMTSAVN